MSSDYFIHLLTKLMKLVDERCPNGFLRMPAAGIEEWGYDRRVQGETHG
jgi:hypothetical protein